MNVNLPTSIKEARGGVAKGIIAVSFCFWVFLIVGCVYPLVQIHVYDIGMPLPAEAGNATDTFVWGMVLSIAMLAFTVHVGRKEYEWSFVKSVLADLSLTDYMVWGFGGVLLLYLQYHGYFGEPKWVHWMKTTFVIGLIGPGKIQCDKLIKAVWRGSAE